MARLCRGQVRQVTVLHLILLALALANPAAAQLYDSPVLVVDPDMHTALTTAAATDAAGDVVATGSLDKTLRIWSAADGKLLRTIRMPAGPNNAGAIIAVAMSRDGNIVAAGGVMPVQTPGKMGAIGIILKQADGLLQVVAIGDDTPAARAGLLPGDLIDTIDGKPLKGLSFSQQVDKSHDAPGTSVTLSILRGPNKTPLEFTLTRAPVPIKSSAIYVFDRNTGKMTGRITSLSSGANSLIFSADGRYLAAVCHTGLHVFDRDRNWAEQFADANYGRAGVGATFAPDGRLATSSSDGSIRLYDQRFNLIARQTALGGKLPGRIAFRPDGKALAVGFNDNPAVQLLDGKTLAPLKGPDISSLSGGNLYNVTWSADGQILFASGNFVDQFGNWPVLAWDQAGLGARRMLARNCDRGDNAPQDILGLPSGALLVVKGIPCSITLQKADGTVLWAHRSPGADFRAQQGAASLVKRGAMAFSVSKDGSVVDFGFSLGGADPISFDLAALKLSDQRDKRTRPPKLDGLQIEDWLNSFHPKLNGKPIALPGPWEESRSLAIAPDGQHFVIGGSFGLYAFDSEGRQLWREPVPGTAWAVNITGDGRLAVAAYADGTVRWHRMDNGREILALRVLSDRKNWVVWTPEGFYGATPGAFGVLKWQVNRGDEAAAEVVPVSAIPRLKRPDALPLVLQELETTRALGIADVAAARNAVQLATGAAVAPGAQLHILTIGVSDYGEKAATLRLKYAAKDASDVASVLLATQGGDYNTKGGGLYAQVHTQFLHDSDANRTAILQALEVMKSNMASHEGGQDLAVIMFSGHGALIDGRFYLLPYGVDIDTLADLESAAISAADLHDKIADLAKYGRVLVLLDTCHSAAITGDGAALKSNADVLRSIIADSNVTVLTSSTTDELSREDEKWGHGVFTKVFLDALREGGESQNGLISMSELTHYIANQVSGLTSGKQHPGIEQRFEGEVFIAGH